MLDQVCKHLIRAGADVNACGMYERTPLFWAVANGRLEVSQGDSTLLFHTFTRSGSVPCAGRLSPMHRTVSTSSASYGIS
jgi:hypothetical protein